MDELPTERTGWLAGARDAKVGQALALLHRTGAQGRATAGRSPARLSAAAISITATSTASAGSGGVTHAR
jgi:hypothetical protein